MHNKKKGEGPVEDFVNERLANAKSDTATKFWYETRKVVRNLKGHDR